MKPGADVLGEQHVASDDGFFGNAGPSREAELVRQGALVHLGTEGESRFLGVLRDDATERRDVFERATHEQRIVHAVTVVGEDPDIRA